MKLYVKYMVSPRCKVIVMTALRQLGLRGVVVDLGVADVTGDITTDQWKSLRVNLMRSGLELMEDHKSILVERIKNVVIELIHYSKEFPLKNYSDYISEKLKYDYTYLSNVFSAVKGMTIQQFIILNKIERVKELLLYDELSLTEISYQMHYSSVGHLSSQFKKITGTTPSYFKKVTRSRNQNLESL
jgi:AraC-like DNA-binding protein